MSERINPDKKSGSLLVVALTAIGQSKFEDAGVIYRELLDSIPSKSFDDKVKFFQGLGKAFLRRNDPIPAKFLFEEALAACQESGNILHQAACLLALGDVNLHLSDLQGSTSRYRSALPLYKELGDMLGEAHCLKRIGNAVFCLSDLDGATEGFETALPIYITLGDPVGQGKCLRSLGDVAILRNDPHTALKYYDRAEPFFDQAGDRVGCASCVRGRGEAALILGDLVDAEQLLQDGCRVYVDKNVMWEQAHAHRLLAKVSNAKGNSMEANSRLSRALELSSRCGNLLEEANCLRDIGMQRHLDMTTAMQHLIKASRIFGEIGNNVEKLVCDGALRDLNKGIL